MNQVDSFDLDRLSGSLQYEEDSVRHEPIANDTDLPPAVVHDRKKTKKEEENLKRAERQREKEAKKARKQQPSKNFVHRSQSTERILAVLSTKKSNACIITLDQTEEYVPLHKEDMGKTFFTRICDLMQLEEKDYFGLVFIDHENNRSWIDNDKRVRHQLKGVAPVFYFQVKFYPPEPALLQEDLTRYQFCLQLRHDILSGKLPCSFITYALLGSYTAQAELGDYSEFDHGTTFDYLKELRFAPVQDDELLRRIFEQHQRHKGQPPNAADLHFLENAKKLAMYGVDIHPAQDSENVEINIGVSANGVLIYRDKLRINRFAWPKILKISYKRKYFFIKLRPSDFDRYESTIGFKLPTYRAAKILWKVAVEHHAFFRLRRPEETRKRSVIPRFNSTFRYTGNYTYHQARQLLLDRPNPDFERTLSKRMSRSSHIVGGQMNQSSIEPFMETRHITIPEKDEDEDRIRFDHETIQTAPVAPLPLPERKPKVVPPSTHIPLPPEPPMRAVSPMVDPDQALLTAIRLATDLDPNKQMMSNQR